MNELNLYEQAELLKDIPTLVYQCYSQYVFENKKRPQFKTVISLVSQQLSYLGYNYETFQKDFKLEVDSKIKEELKDIRRDFGKYT